MTPAQDAILFDPDTRQINCSGDWDISHAPLIQPELKKITWPTQGSITINGSAVDKMDSAGAWLVDSLSRLLKAQGLNVSVEQFAPKHQELLSIVETELAIEKPLPVLIPLGRLASVGKQTLQGLAVFQDYLAFVGHLAMEALRIGFNPKHLRWGAIANVIYRTGFQALPIIALLSLLIGVVITYQMGLQLKTYGANIFIVDLLGLSILREFGPLITAIMVAGRTGSAFTAQLGMMKLNQEIDALDTLGVTPAELLLLPRIIGLFIALPLLTMWADIFGILGGMITSSTMLSISWYDFLERFPTVIPLRALLLGLIKAPVFALIIASVGCYQGMKVEGGADSVGLNTTRSVVLAIFFIIVADAAFSVLFSELKL